MALQPIPEIPPKMGEAGAYQEQLYAILSSMKEHIEALESGAGGTEETEPAEDGTDEGSGT